MALASFCKSVHSRFDITMKSDCWFL